jgi:Sec23-binding domain of Sec16
MAHRRRCCAGAVPGRTTAKPKPAGNESLCLTSPLHEHGRRHAFQCCVKACLTPLYVQVWPLAVLIANSLGPEQLRSTLGSMSTVILSSGSPLLTFAHLAARSFEGAAANLAGAAKATPGTAALGPPRAEHTGQASAGAAVPAPAHLPAWPQQLLMLAAHRSEGDAVAIGALGDRLWSAARSKSELAYAHICYVLAGRLPDSLGDAAAHFAMPGCDACTGACPDVGALQRLELYYSCIAQARGVPMYGLAPAYLMV